MLDHDFANPGLRFSRASVFGRRRLIFLGPEHEAVTQLVEALRYNRNVAGSISDGAFENFRLLNLSFRTMALGSTHALTETCTRNLPSGVKPASAKG